MLKTLILLKIKVYDSINVYINSTILIYDDLIIRIKNLKNIINTSYHEEYNRR